MGCFSHTIDHVGEKIKTDILDEFVKGWIGLFTCSPKTKLAWKETTGLPVLTYSTTRWWSKWEVMKQMMDAFGDVQHFLENHDLPPTKQKLMENQLQVVLAITIAFGEPLVISTQHFP